MITDHLSDLDPTHEAQFKSNRNTYLKNFNVQLEKWKQRMAPFKDTKVVTFHRTWSYFLNEFGMHYIGTLEPVPGIQPSPSHLIQLSQQMKTENVRLILQANYYRDKFANLLADKTGARVLALPPGVGGVPEANDTIGLFDFLVNKITKALSENE